MFIVLITTFDVYKLEHILKKKTIQVPKKTPESIKISKNQKKQNKISHI